MENKRKNHSIVFKGLILVLALALMMVHLPFASIVSMVKAAGESTDYTHMTIGTTTDDVQTVVTRGANYRIAKAFIGGDSNFEIGKVSDGVLYDDTSAADQDVTLKASSVTVKYSSSVLAVVSDGAAKDKDGNDTDAVTVATSGDYLGTFKAERIGAYTITYSYKYQVGSGAEAKTYTNAYDFVVTCELSDAEITFVDNNQAFLPKVYDLNLAKNGNQYKSLELPIPEVYQGEDEQEFDVATSAATATADTTKNYVVVEAFDTNSDQVGLTQEAGKYYLSGAYLKQHAGTYTIKYSYYAKGEFTTSTTKTVKVYDSAYYTNYKLGLELGSTWKVGGETGVASELPTAKGVTASTSTPASESVDVYYTVKVYYKNSGSNYSLIDVDEYNTAAGETVFNADGTLVNPKEFKPLKDGSYSFVYTIYDAYYDENSSTKATHTASTTVGLYEFSDVKDTTAPTPIVYDASTYVAADGYVDASDKLASRANPSGIVVYAVAMEDNVSKVDDEGVVLKRTIMTSDTTTVLTLADYNNKNLIFNYEGFAALQANNYLVRKQTSAITTEVAMVEKLAELNYMIVVDNANYTRLYTLLSDAGYAFDASVTDAATALAWFKTDAAKTAGFAYVNTDKTFGASSANNGTGYGQYYIHYIAKDAAGNEKEVSKSMYVTTFNDDEKPEITFSTSLSDSYLPTATVTFNAPTASDNRDNNMRVNVLYRYLNNANEVVAVAGAEIEDLTEVFDGVETTYPKFVLADANGYINITDTDASSYSIKLEEAGVTATKVQIVVYAYDDMGNVGIYAKEASISNVNDEYPLELAEVSGLGETAFEQGAEITLPKLTVWDDAAAYLTYDVNVNYVDNEGNTTKLSVYDYSSTRDLISGNFGKIVVEAGKFVAGAQGTYQASIAVRDSSNNTIVVFANYSVGGREIIQPPVVNTDFTTKTIELGETVEIPAPVVNYELADSIDYEDYVEGTSTETYIVRRTWSTPYGTKSSFTPTQVGTYDFKYSTRVDIYNRNMFSYNETWAYNPSTGYTKTAGTYTKGTLNFTVENGAFVVDGFTIAKNEDGNLEITKGDDEYLYNVAEDKYFEGDTEVTADDVFGTSAVKSENLVEWFNEFRQYNLESETYTITVKDTQGPTISDASYNYNTTMTTEELSTTGIAIKPIDATDASGIDNKKSKIVLSWKRANGTAAGNTGSKTYEGDVAFEAIEPYKATATSTVSLDGQYTITYTVYDNAGNYTTKAYTIYVGDNEDPTIDFDDNFVETSYTLGTALKLDKSKIHIADNKALPDGTKPTFTLINTTTGDELEVVSDNNNFITFADFEQVGTYTLKVEVEDAVGHVASETFSITVETKSKNVTPVYKIVGIILIVLSVLILVGVVVYFIVSKVKLDKELKK